MHSSLSCPPCPCMLKRAGRTRSVLDNSGQTWTEPDWPSDSTPPNAVPGPALQLSRSARTLPRVMVPFAYFKNFSMILLFHILPLPVEACMHLNDSSASALRFVPIPSPPCWRPACAPGPALRLRPAFRPRPARGPRSRQSSSPPSRAPLPGARQQARLPKAPPCAAVPAASFFRQAWTAKAAPAASARPGRALSASSIPRQASPWACACAPPSPGGGGFLAWLDLADKVARLLGHAGFHEVAADGKGWQARKATHLLSQRGLRLEDVLAGRFATGQEGAAPVPVEAVPLDELRPLIVKVRAMQTAFKAGAAMSSSACAAGPCAPQLEEACAMAKEALAGTAEQDTASAYEGRCAQAATVNCADLGARCRQAHALWRRAGEQTPCLTRALEQGARGIASACTAMAPRARTVRRRPRSWPGRPAICAGLRYVQALRPASHPSCGRPAERSPPQRLPAPDRRRRRAPPLLQTGLKRACLRAAAPGTQHSLAPPRSFRRTRLMSPRPRRFAMLLPPSL